MSKCPIQTCGRQFQNQLTMIQHVKRRHPLQSQKIRQQTTNQMLQKQNKITQQMNKLPKMQRVIQMSKQKKPLQFQRRSTSKQRMEIKNIIDNNQIKVSDIITESRQLLEDNTSSRKILKRPSLAKKPSQEADKLPGLVQSRTKKLKLQAIKTQLSTTLIKQPQQKLLITKESITIQQQMYSTAPNFTQQMGKKIDQLKSRGKLTSELGNRSSSKDHKKIEISNVIKKRLSSHTAQTLAQKQSVTTDRQPATETSIKPVQQQRPVKRLLQRASKKVDPQHQNQQSLLSNQQLSQSTYIQSKSSQHEAATQTKKQLAFPKNKLQTNISKIDSKFAKKDQPPLSTTQEKIHTDDKLTAFNWQQRTVTIRNHPFPQLTIPDLSQVQHLYITNCQLHTIDLNECFSLTSLSLTHNQLSSLSFLNQTLNGGYQNLEQVYLDHNAVSSLSQLPVYLNLKKLSLTFNQVVRLDQVIKSLAKFTLLQEVDLSFNPVRKQPNYKLAVLSVCRSLKKLDGMTVTKYDRQLAVEYHNMYYQYMNILPLSTHLDDKHHRPSTAVSINYQQQFQQTENVQMTNQELEKEIQILEKMVKQTKAQYEIIQEENHALEDQIAGFDGDISAHEQQEFNPKLYAKLCKEIEELEMLNFLQHASEKELEDIINKKIKEKRNTITVS